MRNSATPSFTITRVEEDNRTTASFPLQSNDVWAVAAYSGTPAAANSELTLQTSEGLKGHTRVSHWATEAPATIAGSCPNLFPLTLFDGGGTIYLHSGYLRLTKTQDLTDRRVVTMEAGDHQMAFEVTETIAEITAASNAAGSTSSALARVAWVDLNGSDTTGELGVIERPYATIAAGIAAVAAAGGGEVFVGRGVTVPAAGITARSNVTVRLTGDISYTGTAGFLNDGGNQANGFRLVGDFGKVTLGDATTKMFVLTGEGEIVVDSLVFEQTAVTDVSGPNTINNTSLVDSLICINCTFLNLGTVAGATHNFNMQNGNVSLYNCLMIMLTKVGNGFYIDNAGALSGRVTLNDCKFQGTGVGSFKIAAAGAQDVSRGGTFAATHDADANITFIGGVASTSNTGFRLV